MNVLLITSYNLGHHDGKFYHNYLNEHLERYRIFGDITACCRFKEGDSVGAEIDTDKVTIHRLDKVNTIPTFLKYNRKNKKILAEEIRKADLIICYAPSYLSSYAVRLASKLNKKIIAVAISCIWDAYWNHSLKGKLLAPLSFLNMRRVMRKADFAVYVTSEFLQRRYPTSAPSIGVSDVVLSDFNDNLLAERIDRIGRSPKDYSVEPFNIATCAAVNVKYKSQKDVIKAMAGLKEINFQYYLIGGGDPSALRETAEKLGVADRVHFLGAVPHDQVFELLDKADLYVQPSRQEGLPRAVVEAMSRALPALGSNAGGIPELLDEQYIFKKGDVGRIRQLLKKMLEPEERIKGAKANYARSKEFDTETLNKRRLDFFKKIKSSLDNSQE